MKSQFEKWHAFLIWFVGTLLAIAFSGDSIYLALGVALVSGLLFGIVAWLGARGKATKNLPNQQSAMLDHKRDFK